MEATIQVRKCPNCAGTVHYDATVGKLMCSWCGNTYAESELEVVEQKAALVGYQCPECGAQLAIHDFAVAGVCPFCGNNNLAPHLLEGVFEPDYLIPFSVTRQQATELYHAAVAQKQYLPDSFVEQARIVSVQGTYVPFWLEEGTVEFDFSFVSDTGRRKNNTYGDHRRAGTYHYWRVPADASARMPDDMMDSLDPFDLSALVPYSSSYLAGFVAERYTVDANKVYDRVDRRVKNSAVLACKGDILDDYWKRTTPDPKRSCATVRHEGAEQALFPVWLLVVLFEGKPYLVGVNGQTGKVAVNLPIDEKKQGKAIGKASLAMVLIMALVGVPLIVLGIVILLEQVRSASAMVNARGGSFWDYADLSTIIVGAGLSILCLAVLVIWGVWEGWSKRNEVRASMRNVAKAVHAEDYDVGGLHITLRDHRHGPVHKKDNWSAKR